jgi:hypothetical protein
LETCFGDVNINTRETVSISVVLVQAVCLLSQNGYHAGRRRVVHCRLAARGLFMSSGEAVAVPPLDTLHSSTALLERRTLEVFWLRRWARQLRQLAWEAESQRATALPPSAAASAVTCSLLEAQLLATAQEIDDAVFFGDVVEAASTPGVATILVALAEAGGPPQHF